MTAQRRWAEHYAKPDPTLASHRWNAYDGKRKIRIGYFCSFFDSDTIRCIAVPVVRRSDRQQFECYGYSPSPVSDDISSAFDQFTVTGKNVRSINLGTWLDKPRVLKIEKTAVTIKEI